MLFRQITISVPNTITPRGRSGVEANLTRKPLGFNCSILREAYKPTQDRLIHRVWRPSPARQHRRQPRTREQVQLELVDSDACKPKALKQGAPK
jgi:hypothetical protein